MRHRPGLTVLLALLAALPGVPPAAAQEQGSAAGDFRDRNSPLLSVPAIPAPVLESPGNSLIDHSIIEASGARGLTEGCADYASRNPLRRAAYVRFAGSF